MNQTLNLFFVWEFQILLPPVAEARILAPMIDSELSEHVQKVLFSRLIPSLVEALSFDERLKRLWSFIQENYHQKLTLERTAKECGISKNHMNELLSRATTFTVHELLIRYRLFKAVELMCQKHLTHLTILEIALECGFGSESSFRRDFEKRLGSSPNAFRKELCQRGFLSDSGG